MSLDPISQLLADFQAEAAATAASPAEELLRVEALRVRLLEIGRAHV